MPTWNGLIDTPITFEHTAPEYKWVTNTTTTINATDCQGITGFYHTLNYVTKEELKEQLDKFAKAMYQTLKAMKYLNKDIDEDEFMAVLNEGE